MKKLLLCYLMYFVCTHTSAQKLNQDSIYMRQHYDKAEYMISMRDGVKLYTLVYTPKDNSKVYPILLNRTCYNASSREDWKLFSPSPYLIKDKYIVVYQDVRGRYMSEGLFNWALTPNIPGNNVKDKKSIDESSDAFDTIDWLVKNLKGNNGKVGMLGLSYPGFYTTAALPDAHPALKASSPQAPIADYFFDDFHHMGAFVQSYTTMFAWFGYQKDKQTKDEWFMDKHERFDMLHNPDGYEFHLQQGPLKNFTDKYHYDNFFWKDVINHPNYDEYWQKRNLLPHLKGVKSAVMTVGGWFDAEDLYGSLNSYKAIEKNNPEARNTIVMGPWGHGGWTYETGKQYHHQIYFGDSLSSFYLREIERKFFAYHLKGEGDLNLPEAYMFDTGSKEWKKYDTWPPKDVAPLHLYFGENGRLSINKSINEKAVFEYISDPTKPVPYTSQIERLMFAPYWFMTDDQRNAGRRPDVLTFSTEVLAENVTIAGEILAKLKVSISGTDSDFIVKLIDVYPSDHPKYDKNPENIVMGGYQQLVRSEVFRGRFRNSFEKPEPFKPDEINDVNFPLQDVVHTFKKGHKIMIQIHSTWFPYIDRNPQKYVDNIYKANEEDFIKSTIRVYGNSVIEVGGKLKDIKKQF